MNRTALLTLLAVIALALLLTTEAEAMYHPRLGRFLQRDPVGYRSGSNLYAYCNAKPVQRIDPLGLYTQPCCCTDEPEKCYIELKWAIPQEQSLGDNGKPLRPPGYPGMPTDPWAPSIEGFRGITTRPERGLMKFVGQIAVRLKVIHRDGKPTEGCHLVQDVLRWTELDAQKGREPTWITEDYSPNLLAEPERFDRSPKPGVQNHWGRTAYSPGGSQIVDSPSAAGLLDETPGGLLSVDGLWWQAYVHVREAPSVQLKYGYAFSVASTSIGSGPQWGCTTWEGEDREPNRPSDAAPPGPLDQGQGVPMTTDHGYPYDAPGGTGYADDYKLW